MAPDTGRVVVVGSANVDIVMDVTRRPAAGETVSATKLTNRPGGKGANQAAAAAKLGAEVQFIGMVGADAGGTMLRDSLSEAGVDITHLGTAERPTGSAMITVTPDGENSIVIAAGANGCVDERTVDATSEVWSSAAVLVVQLELKIAVVERLVEQASAAGVRVIVNAAPAAELSEQTLRAADPLILNESEAAHLLRRPEWADGIDVAHAAEAAGALRQLGAPSVVLTLGGQGCLVTEGDRVTAVQAHRVNVLDTTGAGDGFVGAVAARVARGEQLVEAARVATTVAAIAVSRVGSQGAYPDADEVRRFDGA